MGDVNATRPVRKLCSLTVNNFVSTEISGAMDVFLQQQFEILYPGITVISIVILVPIIILKMIFTLSKRQDSKGHQYLLFLNVKECECGVLHCPKPDPVSKKST